MTLTDISVTINQPTTASTGAPVPAGVLVFSPSSFQAVNPEGTFYRAVLQMFYNQECYDVGKGAIQLEGTHVVVNTAMEDEPPIYVSGAFEVECELNGVAGDFDSAEKRKNKIIEFLASKLTLNIGDFS
jgi:hypothetical protein